MEVKCTICNNSPGQFFMRAVNANGEMIHRVFCIRCAERLGLVNMDLISELGFGAIIENQKKEGLKTLEAEMTRLVKAEKYEEAAVVRDKIKTIEGGI